MDTIDAGHASFASHYATDRKIFCDLLSQFDILAHPAQKQFSFVLRQFAINICRQLHPNCFIHTPPTLALQPFTVSAIRSYC